METIFLLLIFVMPSYCFDQMKSDRFFEVIMDRYEVLYENKSIAEIMLKVRKVNKTRSLVGTYNIYEPLGNDFLLEIQSLKKQGGEYRLLPYGVPPTPLCEMYAKDEYCWPDIAKHSEFPRDVQNHCPLKVGNYSFSGVTCKLDNVPRVLSSGDYAAELIYSINGIKTAVYRFYGSINTI